MPGPCSAPNGNSILVNRKPESQKGNINTGKTAKKHGRLSATDRQANHKRLNRAEFERLNES